MLDPRIVANAVLDRADEVGRSLTNLDMQKIVYFLHGHYLTKHGEPLVDGEFEAWSYGPVHKVLYEAFRRFEDGPVEGRASAFDPVRRIRRDLPSVTDAGVIAVLDECLDHYLDIPTFALVELTHQPGTPWDITVKAAERRPNVGMKIANSLILESFEGKARVSHAS